MELVKKNIHMNRQKGKIETQITLEDDVNVSDSKEDIEEMIKEKCNVYIDNVAVKEERIALDGKLTFKILYSTNSAETPIEFLEGEVPFDETFNMDGIQDGDMISVKWELEDVDITLINSRKVSIKAIIGFVITGEYLYDEETAVDIEGEEPVEYVKKSMDVAELMVNNKDIFRVKEEIELSSNKPNIQTILWENVELRNMELKLKDDGVYLKGELLIFVIYSPTEEGMPMQWMETMIPFSGQVDVPGCSQEMIPDIGFRLDRCKLEVRQDDDGEDRIIFADAAIELDIKIYQEEKVDILSDVYAIGQEITPIMESGYYDSLLLKNASKCKASGKVKVDSPKGSILQICNSEGSIKIDDVEVVENGIQVDGVILVSLILVSSDDKYPLCSAKGEIPFSHVIEVQGIHENSNYHISHCLEQLNAVMTGGDEIEIKATLILDTLVMNQIKEPIIKDIQVEPLSMEKIQAVPGLIGYLVKEDDTLWKIAKQYYTTVDHVKEMNDLTSDQIKKGDRLLIVKEM